MRPCAIITLLSDFGLVDAYVGVMKGVILSIAPGVTLVDISHGIAPQDIAAGARMLAGAYRYFPPGTIHVAVVDPGVGSSRQALAVRSKGHFFLGPDNGLLSPVVEEDEEARVRAIQRSDLFRTPVSRTFHGRDVFAPVAAHLAMGIAFEELGPPLSNQDLVRCKWASARELVPGVLAGEVVAVDRFGNLISNLTGDRIHAFCKGKDPMAMEVDIKNHRISGISACYGSVPAGGLVAVMGGDDCLEIAVHKGSAARLLQADIGEPINLACAS